MSGDMSLSAALGGLRIANPDDADTDAPPAALTIVDTPYELTKTTSHASSMRNTYDRQLPHEKHYPQQLQHQQSPPPPPTQQQQQQPLPSHSQLNRVRDLSPSSIHRSQQTRYRSSSDPRVTPPVNTLSRNPSRGRNLEQPSPRAPYVREGSTASFDPTSNTTGTLYDSPYRSSALVAGQAGRPLSTSYAVSPKHDDPRLGPGSAYPSSSSTHHLPSRAASQRHENHGPNPMHMHRPSDNQLLTRQNSRGMSHHSTNHGVPQDGFGSGAPVPTTAEEWKDRGSAVGVKREIDADGRPVMRQFKKGVRDFNFGVVLGEGSYSSVFLASDRQTLKDYAVKVLDKRHIIKEKKIKYVNIEKNTLNRLTEHPGIVRLYYTFQDQTSLYYVLDLCNGGELLGALKKTGTFDVECTRFYGAEILDAIDYMHSRGVIHRDLKPENVLLDDHMHIKITDFGTAKLLSDPRLPPDGNTPSSEDDRAASFVGTAEYVSPELLMNKSACKASDLWAYGCIIYQLLAGRPPFKGGSEYLTFQKIVNLEYEFPVGFPPAAKDLVERCLVLDPTRRLTIDHIKNHEFFDGQYFGKTLWKGQAPRLRPYVPPTPEPNIIQLGNNIPSPPSAPTAPRPRPTSGINTQPRPTTKITELPPPTQIDIDWSPILTRTNERVLKLGDLTVATSPISTSPKGEESHKKLSRFFGGGATRRKQRLVLVTSAGRILTVPASGDEKKVKQEISLLASDCVWRTQQDAKGMMHWCVDTGGIHYSFEEPKTPTPDNKIANEWIESLERAKDIALSQASFSDYNDNGYSENRPVSPASTLGGHSTYTDNFGNGSGASSSRVNAAKNSSTDEFATKRSRFSKRQSKSGLGPVF
ncbi:Serine/threonine-protein kinase ksg1 [Ceratocystis fimbriata CBS 114723]|uniref:non-specific serine/threonine protein kinase n=1 Tax=Ceratocystis fimbriata CBS 114723 TaxID=1035309 RepID=A0A2C5WZP6_9PEZI|nr:Serine/threonine-protein kinase ksg1 [Ceratocystis fimbriata CBS 114723]